MHFLLKTVGNSCLGNLAAQRGCDIVEGEASSHTRLGYLSINNVSFCAYEKIRGKKLILDAISFSVDAGDYVAIVGANGAGKTTLLRCIAQLADFQGEISLAGKSLRHFSRKQLARRIVFLTQSPPTFFNFTAKEVVEMGRYPYLHPLAPPSPHDDELVLQSLAAMEMETFANRTLETLSGGERQKVFLAAALAQQPEILLLDEPTTFLDYRHQYEIRQLLRRISHQRGATIIQVTHDLNAAALDCNLMIALSAGKLLASGKPSEIMNAESLQTIFGMRGIPFPLVAHPSGMPMVLPT